MRSFRHKPDNRRAVYLDLVGSIETQLRDAYAKRYEAGLETQASIAEKLDIDRSTIHRRLTGGSNMTVKTIADMVWALGQCVKLEIFDPAERQTNEHRVIPVHTVYTSIIASPQMRVTNTAPSASSFSLVTQSIQ